jgi:hypothetical protein
VDNLDEQWALDFLDWLHAESGERGSPLPRDRTGGLRFRRGVPEALLHLSRNNRSELARLAREAENALRQSLTALERGGSIRGAVAVLYWHSPDFPIPTIADAFGLDSQRVKALAEENPTVTLRCLDCAAPLRPLSREHFRQMMSALHMLDRDPHLLRGCANRRVSNMSNRGGAAVWSHVAESNTKSCEPTVQALRCGADGEGFGPVAHVSQEHEPTDPVEKGSGATE